MSLSAQCFLLNMVFIYSDVHLIVAIGVYPSGLSPNAAGLSDSGVNHRTVSVIDDNRPAYSIV